MNTKPHIERSRQEHHKALEALSTNGTAGLQLWRKLRRIEGEATRATTAYCNGEITTDQCDAACRKALCAVVKVLGNHPKGLWVNRDPRGYALKLDPDKGAVIPAGMHKDWGGYGILAPEIN